jgi:hypothetical protein
MTVIAMQNPTRATILPACGVVPVSIFRDVHVNYVMRRLGEATDEFFDALMIKLEEYMPTATREERIAKMVSTLARTVPAWGGPIIKQRLQRLMELARDFEAAFQSTFAIYVKDTFANDIQGKQKKIKICIPKLVEFVHAYYSRISLSPEVKRGAYFDSNNTHARNFAVSNALLDALADVAVDNVRVENADRVTGAESESDELDDDGEVGDEDEDEDDELNEPEKRDQRFHTFIPPVTKPNPATSAQTPSAQPSFHSHTFQSTQPAASRSTSTFPPTQPSFPPAASRSTSTFPPTQPSFPSAQPSFPSAQPSFAQPSIPSAQPSFAQPSIPSAQPSFAQPSIPSSHPSLAQPSFAQPVTAHPRTSHPRTVRPTSSRRSVSSTSSRQTTSKEVDRQSALALISKLR